MENTINLSEIRDKVYAKLEPSGWGRILKGFIYSSDFDKIIIKLAEESNAGRKFTPVLKYVFKAFEECPYDSLKVVVLGQDPYPGINIASGIAFSCDLTGELQPSLRVILDEINRTVYDGEKKSVDCDLTRWSNQGVLLINTALTTIINKPGSHYEIWKPFIAYLLEQLNTYNPGLIYIFLGKVAATWIDYINDNNYKFSLYHPASALYSRGVWDSQNTFNEVNTILKKNHNFEIIW